MWLFSTECWPSLHKSRGFHPWRVINWVSWPVAPALEKTRQKHLELKVTLGYRDSLRSSWSGYMR